MAIKIPFLSDVTDFLRGTDNMADALDDVADSLDDVAKDSAKTASKAGDKLGDGFKDGAKTADAALEKIGTSLDGVGDDAKALDRKVSDAFRNIGKDSNTAGKKVEKEFRDGTEGASEGLQDLGSEANSTAKETLASFDGSADSIIGAFQEVAANAFEGFGPAGAAAGMAAAAGIGLAVTMANDAADAVNEAGEAVSALAQEIYDVGGDMDAVDFTSRMMEWGFAIQDTREFWELWQDKAKTGFEEIKSQSEAAGTSWKQAFLAAQGPMEASAKFLADTEAEQQKLTAAIEDYGSKSNAYQQAHVDEAAAINDKLGPLNDQRKAAQDNIETQENAIEVSKMATEVTDDSKESLEAETTALLAKVDALDKAAGRAKTADQAEISYTEEVLAATEAIAANGQTMDINTEAGRANRKTLIDLADSANSLIEAQIDQGASTADVTAQTQKARDSFIQSATAAGLSADEAGRLADKYGLVPKNVDTKVKAHGVQEAKAEIDAVAAPRDVPIRFHADTRPIEGTLAQLNGRDIYVNVRGRGGQTIT